MKKKLLTFTLLLLAVALLWGIPLFARNYIKTSLPSYQSEVHENIGYTLREYHGKIGIFVDSEEDPVSVIDFDIRTLPESEQIALSGGIHVLSEKALCEKLEDYSS